ncbi:hypothetical protein BCR35DRAFT_303349 [Leucosporidium creatinivorum]|uniref:Cysteine-rich transmembrane domain-containing protein n=1 Tax=Leucosporidium creatinivorum TaxID=106004 RepID=A0A1Y2FHT1_9BASI|nr:hypothetical protein BCR35DRAFT_303349 [Leucosporidium creatinivorum]
MSNQGYYGNGGYPQQPPNAYGQQDKSHQQYYGPPQGQQQWGGPPQGQYPPQQQYGQGQPHPQMVYVQQPQQSSGGPGCCAGCCAALACCCCLDMLF